MSRGRTRLLCLALLAQLTPVVTPQTAATATIGGTVSDESGGMVADAQVELRDSATASKRTQPTDSAGQFTFVALSPGDYTLTVTKHNFRPSVLSVKLDVARAYIANVKLTLGQITETLEVKAPDVDLQTSDSAVGNVIQGQDMLRLPNSTRSALVYYSLQPLVMPTYSALDGNKGGQVAGARSDQTSFSLDGVDVSDNVVGNGGGPDKGGLIGPVVPVPAESVEEFRVVTTNPNASYGRAAGGQFAFVTKRGTNNLHGSAYDYLQNDELNANTWTNNRTGIARPELKDNRFGGSIGGPVWKDHTFVYANYEGRRLPQSSDITRLFRETH